jgi:phospho-N-acetylmuramoyl-pentapeptide-transferase
MGDAGSLSFGAALAVTALITGQVLILPIIGIIFVIETGSVLIQIVAVKTIGRRIFRWTPIHGQFELSGWDEEKITLRFWIVAALAAMLGVVFFLSSLHMLQ